MLQKEEEYLKTRVFVLEEAITAIAENLRDNSDTDYMYVRWNSLINSVNTKLATAEEVYKKENNYVR